MQCAAVTSTVFITDSKIGKHNTPRGVGYPSSCNTRQAEHVAAAADTRRPEKTSPRLAQEIWVGTKVGYAGPLKTN